MARRLFNRPGFPRHEFPSPGQPDQQNNVGPQGGLGPKYLVITGKRPGLYWYDNDEFAPQAVVVVDEDQWINGPIRAFAPYVAPVIADGDDWIASLPVDEEYSWKAQTTPDYPILRAITYDEDVLPRLGFDDDPVVPQVSLQWIYQKAVIADDDLSVQQATLDEDFWPVNAYRPHTVPLQAYVADGDDWIASSPVDEDIPWIPRSSPQWLLTQPFTSDDDVWPTPPIPFGVDEDYWYVNAFTPAPYTVPVAVWQQWNLDDEAWPSGIVPVVTPPDALSTPGRIFGGLLRPGLKIEPEEDKRARRAREALEDAPKVKQQVVEHYKQSARISQGIAKARAESAALKIRIGQLEAEALEEGIKRTKAERAKLEHKVLLTQQQLTLLGVQEAVLMEEMEVLDIAFIALVTYLTATS